MTEIKEVANEDNTIVNCKKCVHYQEDTMWGQLKRTGIVLNGIGIILFLFYLVLLIILLISTIV